MDTSHLRQRHQSRTGAIAALALFMLTVLIVMAAFGIELGMFMAEKAEMQRAADAAALAACWEYTTQLTRETEEPEARAYGRQLARSIAFENLVHQHSLAVDYNQSNDADGDIVFGNFTGFGDPAAEMVPASTGVANAVRVRVRQTEVRNGEVRFTLARLLGINSKPLTVEATASIAKNIRGFTSPTGSARLDMLPIAVKDTLWNSLMNGNGDDDFAYDPETGQVTSGSDNVKEINIYPHSTGSSGNSGTVDIGAPGNSTSDVQRQITEGISAEDLSWMGGKIELDASGEMQLNGDTGISAGMKAELQSIIGEPRIIMVYSQVTGNGNNAWFTITKFVGVRVLEVNFQGSKKNSKKLIIQPAEVVSDHVIVSGSGDQTSENVFSPAVLVR